MIQVNRDIYTLRGYRAGVLLRYYRTGMQRAVLPPLPPLGKRARGAAAPPAPPVPAPLVKTNICGLKVKKINQSHSDLTVIESLFRERRSENM